MKVLKLWNSREEKFMPIACVKGDKGPTGDKGPIGPGLQFQWLNTSLGVRKEGDSSYSYSELKATVTADATEDLENLRTHYQNLITNINVPNSVGDLVNDVEYLTLSTLPSLDLSDYALKSDVIIYPMDLYALKSDIKELDLSHYVLRENLPVFDFSDFLLRTEVPTSLPASDVYEWAKQLDKPTYTANEVGAVALNGVAAATKKLTNELRIMKTQSYGATSQSYSGTSKLTYTLPVASDGGNDGVMTSSQFIKLSQIEDKATNNLVTNSLSSTSSTQLLSANQGRILNNSINSLLSEKSAKTSIINALNTNFYLNLADTTSYNDIATQISKLYGSLNSGLAYLSNKNNFKNWQSYTGTASSIYTLAQGDHLITIHSSAEPDSRVIVNLKKNVSSSITNAFIIREIAAFDRKFKAIPPQSLYTHKFSATSSTTICSIPAHYFSIWVVDKNVVTATFNYNENFSLAYSAHY